MRWYQLILLVKLAPTSNVQVQDQCRVYQTQYILNSDRCFFINALRPEQYDRHFAKGILQ